MSGPDTFKTDGGGAARAATTDLALGVSASETRSGFTATKVTLEFPAISRDHTGVHRVAGFGQSVSA